MCEQTKSNHADTSICKLQTKNICVILCQCHGQKQQKKNKEESPKKQGTSSTIAGGYPQLKGLIHEPFSGGGEANSQNRSKAIS